MSGRLLPTGRLRGRLRVPGSKSVTNRALVAAALRSGTSRLLHPLDADDTRTLAAALEALGARVSRGGAAWSVTGPLAPLERERTFDVGPAGTPARFLLALLAALPGRWVLDGSARMRERPMGPLVEALRGLGAEIEPKGRDGYLPLLVKGRRLRGGRVRVRGDVSSQFLSALLLASPLCEEPVALDVEGPAVSGAYVDVTRRTLEAFAHGPCDFLVDGDDSAACFPIAGAVLSGGRVELLGLSRASAQPDALFRRWAEEAGGRLAWAEDDGNGTRLVVEGPAPAPGVRLAPLSIDVDAAPDAALPLAALVAFGGGTSRLSGVARLREKESDRLAAAIELLSSAGAVAREERDADGRPLLVVDGAAGVPRAAAFRARDDHRVAMSAAVLALALPRGSMLDEPDVVSKSYPRFWDDWSSLLAP